MEDHYSDGDDLFARVLAHPRDGKLINQLLGIFGRGYDILRIRELLESNESDLIHTGVWLASELGKKSKALLPYVAVHINHERPWIRALCIDCIQLCADDEGNLIAAALLCIDDSHKGVRWKAMLFAITAHDEQLQSALDYIRLQADRRNFLLQLIDDLLNPQVTFIAIQPHSEMTLLQHKIFLISLFRKMKGRGTKALESAQSEYGDIVAVINSTTFNNRE